MVDNMVDGVKKAAATVSEAANVTAGNQAPDQLHERVVPVPQIDIYSEVPFALVERGGLATSPVPDSKSGKAAARSKSSARPPAKRADNKTTKKTFKKAAKKAAKQRPAKKAAKGKPR